MNVGIELLPLSNGKSARRGDATVRLVFSSPDVVG